MPTKISEAHKQYLITFAAIALIGGGVLLYTIPVAASDGYSSLHHSVVAQLRSQKHAKHYTQLKRRLSEIRARHNRGEFISGFLGISKGELRQRIENGESIHEMANEQGKSRKDFRAYVMDYLRTHTLKDRS